MNFIGKTRKPFGVLPIESFSYEPPDDLPTMARSRNKDRQRFRSRHIDTPTQRERESVCEGEYAATATKKHNHTAPAHVHTHTLHTQAHATMCRILSRECTSGSALHFNLVLHGNRCTEGVDRAVRVVPQRHTVVALMHRDTVVACKDTCWYDGWAR